MPTLLVEYKLTEEKRVLVAMFKIQSEAGGDFNVAEVSFESMVDYDEIVFHDSAVLLHSDDKCSIRIHDFLHPFLL